MTTEEIYTRVRKYVLGKLSKEEEDKFQEDLKNPSIRKDIIQGIRKNKV